MVFKINIAEKTGKTWKVETDSQALMGKILQDTVQGTEVSPELAGYEFEIKGATDSSGFMLMEGVKGIGLKKVLFGYGKGMHKKPKGEGKVNKKPKGLRLRKTVRGETITDSTVQINLKIKKEGAKKLAEVFPEQNKSKESSSEKKE